MRKSSLILAVAAALLVPCLHAHSLHQSTAEAEFNAVTQKLEVSLTVFLSDLELALQKQQEKQPSPDTTFESKIQAYLAQTFVVTDAAGHIAPLLWVGRELEADSLKSGDPALTLFFEIPLPQGLQACTLRHAVFNELFEDQVQLLSLRSGSEKSQRLFNRKAVAQILLP